jgi:acylphosphatase
MSRLREENQTAMSRLREENQTAMLADDDARLSAWVHGSVQGVGFRWWTRARALELGLTGFAANKPDGRVHVVVQGPRASCQRLLDLLQGGRAPGHVDAVSADWSTPGDPMEGFTER